jgi:hypothetical protein
VLNTEACASANKAGKSVEDFISAALLFILTQNSVSDYQADSLSKENKTKYRQLY